jgi:hypothetical protein
MNLEYLERTQERSTGQPYYATIDRFNNDDFTELTELPDEAPGQDLFWTPLTFLGQRKNDKAMGLNILFADLDHKDSKLLHRVWPHLLWETSTGSTQAVWFLTHALPLDAWSDLNQRMTYFMKADKGGWHASKFLRIPGTLNYKKNPPDRGQPLSFQPDADEYVPEALLQSLPVVRRRDAELGDHPDRLEQLEWEDHIRKIWPKIDLGTRSNLMRTRQKDRSQAIIYTCNRLLNQGISTVDTFLALEGTNWNKFKDEPSYLWKVVNG